MAIATIDAGDRLVIETTLSGIEMRRSQLPVTERLPADSWPEIEASYPSIRPYP
jgi:hypothetical protein